MQLTKTHREIIPIHWRNLFYFGFSLFVISIWGYIIFLGSIPESDWRGNYLPAIKDLFRGNSPYVNHSVFNPFWTFILLSPFALLPPVLGQVFVGIACLVCFAFVGLKLGAKPQALVLLLSVPQLLFLSRNGGIDWIVALGFILPPQTGLFFVLIKPQIGIAVALFWVIEAWKKGKIKEIIRIFLPVSVGYLLGYLLFGVDAIWRGSTFIGSNHPWDATTFPLSIPIGLALLISAIQTHSLKHSILASPFLAPYVAFYSWAIIILGLSGKKYLFILVIIGMWAVAFITKQF